MIVLMEIKIFFHSCHILQVHDGNITFFMVTVYFIVLSFYQPEKRNDNKCMHVYIIFFRIPWLAPELFSDLTKTTISSDIYAFSTTLWECATLGSSPLWNPSLRDFQNDSNKVFIFCI